MRKYIIKSIFFLSVLAIIISCQNQDEIDYQNYITKGKELYQARCQNCHGANGEGLGELTPALTDSVYLKNNKDRLACIIKNGLNEPITINGKEYHEKMPGYNDLADIDIAKIIVYITNSFGNNQGFKNYKTVSEDLNNCK
jgi:mono/diheme cytochrome c family protein